MQNWLVLKLSLCLPVCSYQFEKLVDAAVGDAGDRQVQLAQVVPARRAGGEEREDLGVEGLARVQFHSADFRAGLEQEPKNMEDIEPPPIIGARVSRNLFIAQSRR